MRKLNRFWSGLEAVPGLAGISAEWREVWGHEVAVGKPFLRSTGRLATFYPCPYPGGDGCPRGVVMHSDHDIVAACRSNPRQCDTIKLTKDHITILAMDWQALGSAIAKALALTPSRRVETILPGTARLGWHNLTGGKRAAVYLTIQHEPQAFAATLSRLLSDVDLPFVLASPTDRLCQSDSGDLLSRAGVVFLPLSECLSWDETGEFVPTERAMALLADLSAADSPKAMPSRSRGRRARVAQVCPPRGTRWGELQLVMEDHFLAYEVRDERDRSGFAEAGFEDGRRGNIADQIWELLLEFARGGGTLREDALTKELKQNLRQHVSTLGRRLHGLFRIPGRPIARKERGEPYRAAFRIRPKEGISIAVPADCTWPQISIIETRAGTIRFVIETKERYLAHPQEVAERVNSRTVERTLDELGLLGEEGEPTRVGRALLEALRANGRPSRPQDDDDMIRLCGHLCQLTGIGGSPFDFVAERGGWCARFHAESQAGQM